jgi:transposase
MDDINYIRKMFKNEGVSVSEIQRRTGLHMNTIKKYLDMDDFNEYHYPELDRPSLLDPLKPIIDEWLIKDMKAPRKQRHTAQRVFDRLQAEYPDQLEVKLRTVQYYVSTKRKELYEERTRPAEAKLPIDHPAGEAQVDFGKVVYYDNSNTMQDAYKLTVSFPYSNAAYCQIFRGQNLECLLQGIINITNYIGYVPNRMVFDNLSAAVVKINKDGNRILTDGFMRFINHYYIDAVFCNPYSGWEKGNVEGKVGYERRNMFVPVPTILDFDDFNKHLLEACDKNLRRSHYKKEALIIDLFENDKRQMRGLPEVPFNAVKLVTAKTDKYAKAMFETNKYSTAPSLALSTVYLEISSDTVKVMDGKYKVITVHSRVYEKNRDSMNWVPYIALMAKRPTALKYTGFYKELPTIWQEYLNKADPKTKKEALLVLNTILQKHDIAIAADALSATIANGVQDAVNILVRRSRSSGVA